MSNPFHICTRGHVIEKEKDAIYIGFDEDGQWYDCPECGNCFLKNILGGK